MNELHFDDMLRTLTRSRRSLAAGAVAAIAGLLIAPGSDAKKKRKRKHKKRKPKAQPNEFGCFEVGDPCTSEADCCSGVCEGKKCRAHGTDVCGQDEPGVCTAPFDDIPSLGCGTNCFCYRTTAGSNFCSSGVWTGDQWNCTDCKTDADCLALGFPAGSACAQVGRGICSGWCDSGMACLLPCGTKRPDEPDE
jgi:hypothetical protein